MTEAVKPPAAPLRSRGLLAALLLTAAFGSDVSAQLAARPARVEVVVPSPPVPVPADGRVVLAYELHVTNFGTGALRLRQLDVFDAGPRSRLMATYGDARLGGLLQPVGAAMMGMSGETQRLEPGRRTVVFLWLPLAADSVPARLRHHLVFDLLDSTDVRRDGGTQEAVDNVMVTVAPDTTPLIRAPLDGGEWVLGGSSNDSAHRRSLTALDAHAWIGQRFAIDWVKIGPNGNTWRDDEHRNESYWGFGESVHAVAGGEVVALVDSIADHSPHGPAPPVTIATIAGNYVIGRIAPGRFASYAHLKRGSIRVRLHQRVARGDVIGQIGDTGQTTGPHLHFQISDRPSILASEGIPFRLERFQFLGMAADFEESHHVNVPRRREMPLDNQVVGLP